MFAAITFIYNLDKKKVAEMNDELTTRRAAVKAASEASVEANVQPDSAVEEIEQAANTLENNIDDKE
jgi:hypothetical protein